MFYVNPGFAKMDEMVAKYNAERMTDYNAPLQLVRVLGFEGFEGLQKACVLYYVFGCDCGPFFPQALSIKVQVQTHTNLQDKTLAVAAQAPE